MNNVRNNLTRNLIVEKTSDLSNKICLSSGFLCLACFLLTICRKHTLKNRVAQLLDFLHAFIRLNRFRIRSV